MGENLDMIDKKKFILRLIQKIKRVIETDADQSKNFIKACQKRYLIILKVWIGFAGE